ncbi:Rpp20 subunit of nuclear RNase MRP and P-domain-containing protein [Pyrenochaeta sp. MPI-SDFR-AT-0127]|nr:Rpp20 subunit of nuclear RNase MRP and P-domain-containing protein [Pyrenochaeta sp. MPI-SDFR-AT-0127]
MAGQKRTRSGRIKQQNPPQLSTPAATVTTQSPADPQAQEPSSKSTKPLSMSQDQQKQKKQMADAEKEHHLAKPDQQPTQSKPHSTNHKKRQKLPKLPENATISKRPLLHPAIPTPFASSSSPKVLYISATTPYIPALKRIRKLLTEITKREQQASAAWPRRQNARKPPAPNGRLAPTDVERAIADGARKDAEGSRSGGRGEAVYLKATGRAIPRALELGVHFQSEEDCWVRVEMGSIKAIDDIEVRDTQAEEGDGDKAIEARDEEDIPETRIRTLSSITVSVGLK